MDDDIVEKVAILQGDMETFAIEPHTSGGLTNPEHFRKITDVAERYKVPKDDRCGESRYHGHRPR